MNNFEDLINHETALTVSCQECGAKVGEDCTRVDIKGQRHALQNFPAHLSRLKRVDRLERLHQLDALRASTFQRDAGMPIPGGPQAAGASRSELEHPSTPNRSESK
ncbi:zinc finger domain-containing protein [Rhodococcus qingshengii]